MGTLLPYPSPKQNSYCGDLEAMWISPLHSEAVFYRQCQWLIQSFLQAALCLHAKDHSLRWSAGICPHCYKSECDLGVLVPDMITLVKLSWKTWPEFSIRAGKWRVMIDSLFFFMLNTLESNNLEQDWFLVVTDTLSKTMLLLMFFVSLQSPLQLAEELQSKPLNSEIRELLKLLSKPNLKVRMCCLHLLKWTHGCFAQLSKSAKDFPVYLLSPCGYAKLQDFLK